MINQVFNVSDKIKNNRKPSSIILHLMQEVGELSTEIQISEGFINKKEGIDGIVGEAIDVIICALDIIHTNNPKLTEQDIIDICNSKLQKWMLNNKLKQ